MSTKLNMFLAVLITLFFVSCTTSLHKPVPHKGRFYIDKN